jgi:hypothetical protein
MWWRPPAKYRPWWDTDFSRKWMVTGMFALFWALHFTPFPHPQAANDSDFLRW